MEGKNDIKENKKTIDLRGAPALQQNNIYYNCTECSSAIEILSINEEENLIEFKCNNNHKIKMSINEYINKMKEFNNEKLNNNICNKHQKENYSFCFDCNIHLCKECIKTKKHNYHYKIYLMEIIPEDNILNEIENIIEGNKKDIKKLNSEKIHLEKKLKKILNSNINKIKVIKDTKRENNKNKEYHEIKMNIENYSLKLEKLKEEYENQIKKIKLEYITAVKYIKNKYKSINDNDESEYNYKISKLNNKYNIIKNI